mgnify:FL=1
MNFKTKEVVCKLHNTSLKKIDKELLEVVFNKSLTELHLIENTKNLIYFKLVKVRDCRYSRLISGSYERLETILLDMKYTCEHIHLESNNTLDIITIVSNIKIKTLYREILNIEHRLGIQKGYLTVKEDLGRIIFEIRKETDKVYYFDEIMNHVNKPIDQILPMLVGVEVNTGKAIIKDLTKMTHVLIGGMTNTGKSTTLVSMLDSLLFFNFDKVILFVSDFKENMMLKYYNISNCRYVEPNEESLMTMYKMILDEYYKRVSLFKSLLIDKNVQCRDIHKYNEINSDNQLPYIVIAIDEINSACQMNFKELEINNMDFNKIRTFLLTKSRSVGIHFIDSVQKATTDQYRKSWRASIETRICHKMSETSEVDFVLQSSKEDSIKAMSSVKGEFLFKDELSEIKKLKGCLVDENSRIFKQIQSQKRIESNAKPECDISEFRKKVIEM